MKKSVPIMVMAALLCSLAAVPRLGEAATYSFMVSNPTKTVYCGPLEIKIINNGLQVANAYSKKPLEPGQAVETMQLSSDYCTKIQLKAVCSGSVNQHEKGCFGGRVVISSPTEMFY